MGISILQLKPAVYSRSKKVDELKKDLAIAPKQIPTSPEAFAGNVIDFRLADNSDARYGTLQEFYQSFHPSQIIVECIDGKVFIQVHEHKSGPFFKVRGFTQKYNN